VPIYEYYCPDCQSCFSHLARRFDEPVPVCPGCGSVRAQKMVSRVNVGRSDAERKKSYDERSKQVAHDPQESARLLQQAGSMAEEYAPINADAFREIIDRRAAGVSDDQMQDVVDAALPPVHESYGGSVQGHEHAHDHDHSHEHVHTHDHGHEHAHEHETGERRGKGPRPSRRGRNLGWS